MKKLFICSFLLGFMINTLSIFGPYVLLGESAAIRQYLEANRVIDVVVVSIPYLLLDIMLLMIFLLLYHRGGRVPETKVLLISLCVNIAAFYLVPLLLTGIAISALSNWTLF